MTRSQNPTVTCDTCGKTVNDTLPTVHWSIRTHTLLALGLSIPCPADLCDTCRDTLKHAIQDILSNIRH